LNKTCNFTVEGRLVVAAVIQTPVVTEPAQTMKGEENNLNNVGLALYNARTMELPVKTGLYLASLLRRKRWNALTNFGSRSFKQY
jgi:hypothetical protein